MSSSSFRLSLNICPRLFGVNAKMPIIQKSSYNAPVSCRNSKIYSVTKNKNFTQISKKTLRARDVVTMDNQ